jgi:excisionase family DNA binding protein
MVTIEIINERLDRIENLLISKKDVLNLNELCSYTGLSKSYLYKLTSANLIPYYRPNGKQIYFSKSEIDLWLLKNRNATHSELEEKAINYVISKK